MSFDSLSFILIFLPAALLLYTLVPRRAKNAVLLLLSLVFYAWGEPLSVVLLILSIAFNYLSGLEIGRRREAGRPDRGAFALSVAGNLLILLLFQYSGFLLDMINRIFRASIVYHSPGVPLGVVFFTLQGLSYLTDVHQGACEAERSPVAFALYIAMFPKIALGPIVRYPQIRPQLFGRRMRWDRFGDGVMYFIRGLSKTLLLASPCGEMFSSIQNYAEGSEISAATAWLGCLAFSFEIYFELSGYADMAVGLGRMFGFDLPENFRYPYTAASFRDFWKRWHITFVSWVRDYIYTPLFGRRRGAVRMAAATFIAALVFGLLHGASLHYLAWGVYMGLLLVVERLLYRKFLYRLPSWLRRCFVLFFIGVGWTFFFSTSVRGALCYIGVLFSVGASGIADAQSAYLLRSNLLLLLVCGIFSTPYAYRFFYGLCMRRRKEKVAAVVALYLALLFICVAFIVTGTGNHYYVWN